MHEFRLPDVGEGIAEAELLEWRVGVGDRVEEGDDIAVVNTDKVTVELPSPCAGRISSLHGEAGEIIAVGTVLVVIDDGVAAARTPAPGPAPEATPRPVESRSPGRIIAAPSTRRLAHDLGVDLAGLGGSGPDGRILRADVELAAEPRAVPDEPSPSPSPERRRLPLSGARATAARQLAQSVHRSATSTTSFEVRGDGLRRLLERSEGESARSRSKLSPVAVIAKCVARALMRHERFNATIDESANALELHQTVDLGIAVAAPSGLVVPVVRGVEQRPLLEVAAQIAELSERARDGRLQLGDLKGGSFTLSSTGGMEQATIISTRPIINPPQTAILWASRITDRPRVVDGRLEAGPMLACSLSFDHRYIDGAEATWFINDLAALLESPESISL